ncbi:MAG: hypothetical protein ACFB15_09200 [Cyclobacteriaceae bacterium]
MERLFSVGFFKMGVFIAVCLIVLLPYSSLVAQSARFFKVQAGEIPVRVLPQEAQYRFADFRWGKAIFLNGHTASAKVNYNILYEEMQFIARKQDTLTIADEPTVEKVVVNDTSFYYHPDYGYLEELAGFTNCKLANSQRLQAVRDEDLGSSSSLDGLYESNRMGRPSQFLQPVNYGVTEQEFYHQPARQSLTLVLLEDYYFMDFNRRWHPAQKSTIRKVFRSHQKKVTRFIDEEKINFNDAQDLIKLLRYCSELE